MKGYTHTYGKEREYPEVIEQRAFFAEVIAIIHEDPEKEAARLKRNEEKTAEMMRKESIFWGRFIGLFFVGVVAFTVLIANL